MYDPYVASGYLAIILALACLMARWSRKAERSYRRTRFWAKNSMTAADRAAQHAGGLESKLADARQWAGVAKEQAERAEKASEPVKLPFPRGGARGFPRLAQGDESPPAGTKSPG